MDTCAYNICAIINHTGKYSFRQLPYYVMFKNNKINKRVADFSCIRVKIIKIVIVNNFIRLQFCYFFSSFFTIFPLYVNMK